MSRVDVGEDTLRCFAFGDPGCCLLQDDGIAFTGAERILRAHRDAVHCRAVVVRNRGGGEHRLRGDPPEAVLDGDGFAARRAIDRVDEQRQRLAERLLVQVLGASCEFIGGAHWPVSGFVQAAPAVDLREGGMEPALSESSTVAATTVMPVFEAHSTTAVGCVEPAYFAARSSLARVSFCRTAARLAPALAVFPATPSPAEVDLMLGSVL